VAAAVAVDEGCHEDFPWWFEKQREKNYDWSQMPERLGCRKRRFDEGQKGISA
jgi:hypothetical protein